jgi:hypothetical protein
MCNNTDHGIDTVQQTDLVFPTRRCESYLSAEILSLSFRDRCSLLCEGNLNLEDRLHRIPISSELHVLMALKSFLFAVVITNGPKAFFGVEIIIV